MKLLSLFVLATALFACSTSTTAPPPGPASDAGRPVDTLHIGHGRHGFSPPALVDPRLPAEMAQSACPPGRCTGTSVRPILAATTSVPVTPVSWTVPDWYIDSGNSTGCALNSNSGTAATCSGGCSGSTCPSGIGPVVTVTEITTHRWGTASPTLPQTTTFHVLSSQTIGQEKVVLSPIMVRSGAASNFIVLGTPHAVGGTFASGTVTAKARGTPGQLLKIAAMPGGTLAGQLVFNTTRNSWATIDSITTGTATMTQPLSNAVLTTVTAQPDFSGSEVDTWSVGDTLQLFTETLFNLVAAFPVSGDSNGSFTAPTFWMQNIYIPDVSGTTGNSTTTFKGYGCGTMLSNSRLDTFTLYDGTDTPYGGNAANVWLNGGADFNATSMIGGAANTAENEFNLFENVAEVDGDAILHGPASSVSFKGGYSIVGFAYVDAVAAVTHGSVALLEGISISDTACQLWGPGSVNLEGPNSAMQLAVGLGNTWTGSLTVASLSIEGVGTGTSYAAGTWTDGITLTPGHLDSDNGLQNPRTGNRYSGN